MFGSRPGRVGSVGKVGGSNRRPSLALDFQNSGPSGDARLTTSRAAGGATLFDQTGTLQLAAANTQRIDYGPLPGTYNWIRNSTMVGTVVGTVGTMPTNWSQGGQQQVVGIGVESGLTYIDVLFSGATAQGGLAIQFDTVTATPTIPGRVWTNSAYFSIVGGSMSGVTLQLPVRFYDSSTAFLSQTLTGISVGTGPIASQRFSLTDIAPANAAYVTGALRIVTTGAYSFVIRIAAPQLELSSVATPFVPTAGTAAGGFTANWIRNSAMQGASVGVLPTFWGAPSGSGVTISVVGIGTESGIPYTDFSVSGTPTATTGLAIAPEPIGNISQVSGQQWTASVYLKMISGDLTNTSITNAIWLSDGTSYAGANVVPTNADLSTQRFVNTASTTNNSPTLYQRIRFPVANGQPVSFVLRVGAPQLEKSATVSPWISTSGTVASSGTMPIGLLAEEPRTNSIRNPRSEGAVAPSTPPTSWGTIDGITPVNGISASIVDTVTEAGIPAINVRWQGTATATTSIFIRYEGNQQVAAVNGQAWAIASFLRIVGGSLSSLTASGIQLFISERDAGGTNLALGAGPTLPVTTGPLALQRFTYNATNSNATTAFVMPGLTFAVSSGQTIDLTLRIGAPQLELGTYITSTILPDIGTPVSSTRAAESISIPVTAFNYNPAQGTLKGVGIWNNFPSQSNRGLAMLDDGGAEANNVEIWSQDLGISVYSQVKAGGVSSPPQGTSSGVLAGARQKLAINWDGTNTRSATNGAFVGSLSAIGSPTGITRLLVGRIHPAVGTWMIDGYVCSVSYWPRAISPTELIATTT